MMTVLKVGRGLAVVHWIVVFSLLLAPGGIMMFRAELPPRREG
jgi:hypothetical protein